MNISQFLNFLFFISLAFYFPYSYLNLEETGYWMVHYGFPILILDLLAPAFILYIFVNFGEGGKKIRTKYVDEHHALQSIVQFICMFAAVLIIYLNPKALLYFLASMGLKTCFVLSKGMDKKMQDELASWVLVILIMALIAIPASAISLFYEENAIMVEQYLMTNIPVCKTHSTFFDSACSLMKHPGYITTWGTLSYLSLAVIILKPGLFNSLIKRFENGKRKRS